MAVSETDLIDRYFRPLGAKRADVSVGIGDDAAVLELPAARQLVLTTDALIEGVHFLADAPPRSLGHRALAVNLSDIAAMGATPMWTLLSLNLPRVDESWLAEFAAGFGALATRHSVALVGGNLSRGALSITLTLAGSIVRGAALRRDTAQPGDELYVSGTVGDAAEGLKRLGADATADPAAQFLRARFEYPTPRVALGEALSTLASACIDVSDGLYADASRLLQTSGCGAELDLQCLPLSAALRASLGEPAWRAALRGGEDYELCFTARAERAGQVAAAAAASGDTVTRIGRLLPGRGLTLRAGNTVMQFSALGFDHFRE